MRCQGHAEDVGQAGLAVGRCRVRVMVRDSSVRSWECVENRAGCASRHCLCPRDMSFEAKRFRHVAVAVTIVAIGGVVAMCSCQQRTKPQQPDLAYHQTLIRWRVRQPGDRCLGFDHSASAPRSSNVSTRTPVAGTPHPTSRPSRNRWSTAARMSGMALSRSPRRARSRAKYTLMIGNSHRLCPGAGTLR